MKGSATLKGEGCGPREERGRGRGRGILRLRPGKGHRDFAQDDSSEEMAAHRDYGAAREFALGIEALERFVRKETLRRVHECVFGVLALESEPIDPRL